MKLAETANLMETATLNGFAISVVRLMETAKMMETATLNGFAISGIRNWCFLLITGPKLVENANNGTLQLLAGDIGET